MQDSSKPGKRLDVSSEPHAAPDVSQPESVAPSDSQKRFLGVHFECCDIYLRIYPNRDNTAYVGTCPKCAKQLRIGIGGGGTSSRFFRVS